MAGDELRRMKKVEIVELRGDSNGRSCMRHEVCGASVKVNDILRIKKTVVSINEELQEAVKFVTINDMAEACTVGFCGKALRKRLSDENKLNSYVRPNSYEN